MTEPAVPRVRSQSRPPQDQSRPPQDQSRPPRADAPAPVVPLGEDGERLWYAMLDCYDLAPHELELLGQAGATLDLIGALDSLIIEGGELREPKTTRVRQITDLRKLFVTLIAEMHLPAADGDVPADLPGNVPVLLPRRAARG